jgi:hypothetical protein
MSKHVHFLIDKNKLVPTGDGFYTSLTESLARNERLISHFLQNGNNERVISLCENCLQQVDNLNQTDEESMSRILSWANKMCQRSSNLKLDIAATEFLLNRLQNNEKVESNIYALLFL